MNLDNFRELLNTKAVYDFTENYTMWPGEAWDNKVIFLNEEQRICFNSID